ncbi:MAG: preprotein translocase subunit SecG [bacterium]
MYSILIILILFGAVLMIAVVLLQPGKGDLTATFGGLSSQFGAVFGMQRANDLLAKVTKWIAAIILVLILLTNKFFVSQESVEQQLKPVTEGASVPTQQQMPGALTPPPVSPQPGQQPQQENK